MEFADRYSRQVLFPGIGAEGQNLLSQSRVAIVGCGATGTSVSGLLARAQRDGVAYLPGKHFAVAREHRSSLRLSFAGLTPDQIEHGVAVLGRIFGEETTRVRSAMDAEPEPALV